jgi:hypothetical protein
MSEQDNLGRGTPESTLGETVLDLVRKATVAEPRIPMPKGMGSVNLVVLAIVLWIVGNGCAPQPAPSPSPSPPPSPQPTPTPVVMDEVVRADGVSIRRSNVIFFNGTPLQSPTRQAASLVLWTEDGRLERLLIPLRPLGNAMKKPVRWDGNRRRVFFGGKQAPAPLTLIRGRSYLTKGKVKDWLDLEVNERLFDKNNPDDGAGYVEIRR